MHYSWSIASGDETLTLSIMTILNPTTNLTGAHAIRKDELTVDDNGSVMTQRYTGAQNFSIPAQESQV